MDSLGKNGITLGLVNMLAGHEAHDVLNNDNIAGVIVKTYLKGKLDLGH